MLDNFRKLARQSAIYGLGTLSTKLVGFVLIPLYTKSFNINEFGILGLFEVTTAVILSFLGFSLYSGFFRWYWDDETSNRKQSLFFTVTVFQLFVAVIAYVAAYPFLSELSYMITGYGSYNYVLNLMLISSLMQLMLVMPNTLMRLQEKPWLFTAANFSQLILSLVVTIYFIVYRKAGLEGVYYGQIAGNAASGLVLLHYTIRNMVPRFEMALLKKLLVYCTPLFFSSVALVTLNVTDRYALKAISNLADVGLYSYGFKLANTLNVFLITSVNFAIQPMIFRMMNEPGNKQFYSRLMTYYTYGTMLAGLVMMVFAPEIAKLFAKRVEYFEAWQIFPFIIYAVIFGMLKDLATTGLSITKHTKIIAVTVIISAVINIVLNYLLIRLMGNHGAALSKLLTMIVFFALTLHYSQKVYPIPYELKRVAILLVIAAIFFLISLLFNGLPVILRLAGKSILVLAYPFVLYLLKFYSSVEITMIRSGWEKWSNLSDFKTNVNRLINK
jgi:O-antigen/teichoic acid export membrane protein